MFVNQPPTVAARRFGEFQSTQRCLSSTKHSRDCDVKRFDGAAEAVRET
jgi:hypothetical protein